MSAQRSGRTILIALLAFLGTLGACRGGTEPQAVGSLRFVPDSAHLVVGEAAAFIVQVFDTRGAPLPDRVQRVEVDAPATAVADVVVALGQIAVTALAPGAARLTARLGFGEGEAFVYVAPARVASIDIEPDLLQGSTNGVGQTPDVLEATVRLFDQDGVELSPVGHRISWRSDYRQGPFWPQLGPGVRFHASSAGSGTLRVVVNDLTASIPVTVVDP